MASKILFRRDQEANWQSTDPVLSQGELALSIDINKFKIGDGTTAWSNLTYILGDWDYIINIGEIAICTYQ